MAVGDVVPELDGLPVSNVEDVHARPREASATVLLVKDHDLLAESLRIALTAEGIDVRLAPLSCRQDVIEAARQTRPSVVLLDLDLGAPIGDGGTLVQPLVDTAACVLVVTGTTRRSRVAASLAAGAIGFVAESRPLEELVASVRALSEGRPCGAQSAIRELGDRNELEAQVREDEAFATLTPREQMVPRGLWTEGPSPRSPRRASSAKARSGARSTQSSPSGTYDPKSKRWRSPGGPSGPACHFTDGPGASARALRF